MTQPMCVDVAEHLVLYPSGQCFSVCGVFVLVGLGADAVPFVRDGNRMYLLDPRAVVIRDDVVVHDPRSRPSRIPWVRAWLAAHPEWPRVATEVS